MIVYPLVSMDTWIKSVHFKKPVARSLFLLKSVVIFNITTTNMTTLFERNEDCVTGFLKWTDFISRANFCTLTQHLLHPPVSVLLTKRFTEMRSVITYSLHSAYIPRILEPSPQSLISSTFINLYCINYYDLSLECWHSLILQQNFE